MRILPAIAAVLVLFLVLAAGAVSASAEPSLPAYESGFFPTIHGPADPEEYRSEVHLHPGQDLRQIDDQSAAIYFEDMTMVNLITATPARDAWGAAVPTDLSVSDGNVIALTVHHHAVNPANDGAPFVYPVSAGSPYEVGYSSVTFVAPPSIQPEPPTLAPSCVVPRLKGQSLKVDRRKLREAGCRLGDVRGVRSKSARVVRQYPQSGTVLERDATVGVRLGG
jgi:hypothetical protein